MFVVAENSNPTARFDPQKMAVPQHRWVNALKAGNTKRNINIDIVPTRVKIATSAFITCSLILKNILKTNTIIICS